MHKQMHTMVLISIENQAGTVLNTVLMLIVQITCFVSAGGDQSPAPRPAFLSLLPCSTLSSSCSCKSWQHMKCSGPAQTRCVQKEGWWTEQSYSDSTPLRPSLLKCDWKSASIIRFSAERFSGDFEIKDSAHY